MDRWLNRNFVPGWVLASVVSFAVAGAQLSGRVGNPRSTAPDALLWAGIGLLSLLLAMVFRPGKPGAAH